MKELKYQVMLMAMETLDGKVVDGPDISVPQIIGVTDLDEEFTNNDAEGTIISPDHNFWHDYERDIETMDDTIEQLSIAIKILTDEGTIDKRQVDENIFYFEIGEDNDE